MMTYFVFVGLIAGLLFAFLRFVVPLRSLLSPHRRCPCCGSETNLTRVPRVRVDRFLGRTVNCRRYRCLACLWSGLLREEKGRSSVSASASSDGEVPAFQDFQEMQQA